MAIDYFRAYDWILCVLFEIELPEAFIDSKIQPAKCSISYHYLVRKKVLISGNSKKANSALLTEKSTLHFLYIRTFINILDKIEHMMNRSESLYIMYPWPEMNPTLTE